MLACNRVKLKENVNKNRILNNPEGAKVVGLFGAHFLSDSCQGNVGH